MLNMKNYKQSAIAIATLIGGICSLKNLKSPPHIYSITTTTEMFYLVYHYTPLYAKSFKADDVCMIES